MIKIIGKLCGVGGVLLEKCLFLFFIFVVCIVFGLLVFVFMEFFFIDCFFICVIYEFGLCYFDFF